MAPVTLTPQQHAAAWNLCHAAIGTRVLVRGLDRRMPGLPATTRGPASVHGCDAVVPLDSCPAGMPLDRVVYAGLGLDGAA
jgi:hypothetical protein